MRKNKENMKEQNGVSCLKSIKNNYNVGNLQGLALDTFKKFDVDLERIKNEVTIVNFEMVDYEEKNKSSVFGEKESISYVLYFTIYNIEFEAKLLTFQYEAKSEVLKLDINCKTSNVYKEIKYCCNFLQRRRNLNLMFITLITFARYLESRRLICDLILKRSQNVKIEENKDGGKIVAYLDEKRNIKLGVFWSVECNSDHEVIDKVEIYYKLAELPKRSDIKNTLTQLTEPHLKFNEKYHLWKNLLRSLSDGPFIIVDNVTEVEPLNSGDKTCIDSEEILVMAHAHLIPNRIKVKKEEPNDEDDDDYDVAIISSSPLWNQNYESNPIVCIKNPKLLSKNSKEASILLSDIDEQEEQFMNIQASSKCNRQTDDKLSHIIYIDSLDDKNISKGTKFGGTSSSCTVTSSSTCKLPETLHTSQNDVLNPYSASFSKSSVLCQNRTQKDKLLPNFTTFASRDQATSVIELTDVDSESIIVLPSDTEDKEEIETGPSLSDDRNFIYNSASSADEPARNMTRHNKVAFSTERNDSRLDFVMPPKRRKIVDDDLEITGVTYVIPD